MAAGPVGEFVDVLLDVRRGGVTGGVAPDGVLAGGLVEARARGPRIIRERGGAPGGGGREGLEIMLSQINKSSAA